MGVPTTFLYQHVNWCLFGKFWNTKKMHSILVINSVIDKLCTPTKLPGKMNDIIDYLQLFAPSMCVISEVITVTNYDFVQRFKLFKHHFDVIVICGIFNFCCSNFPLFTPDNYMPMIASVIFSLRQRHAVWCHFLACKNSLVEWNSVAHTNSVQEKFNVKTILLGVCWNFHFIKKNRKY